MRHHAVSLALVTALFAAAPAAASLVDREAVTLGRLVDDLDLALVVRVDAARGDALDLAVLERLRGPAVPDALRLVLSHEVACDLAARPGERLALFLALGPDGRAEAPVTVWQAVRLPDDAAAALVRDAVRSRAPTIGGDPRALERALFRQVEADGAGPAAERVRADAALDLLAFSALAPGPAEVGALARALERAPSVDLARLAARAGDAALVAPLLRATRAPGPAADVRRAAAEALAALDPDAAAEALAGDVDAADPARATIAVEGLGALRDLRAARRLTLALDDPRPAVRRAALRALGDRPDAEALARLEALARDGADDDARGALAALARAGAGQALRRLEADLPDPARRALAGALRRDPVSLSDQILDAVQTSPSR